MTTHDHENHTPSAALPATIATLVVTIVGVVLFVLPTVHWIS